MDTRASCLETGLRNRSRERRHGVGVGCVGCASPDLGHSSREPRVGARRRTTWPATVREQTLHREGLDGLTVVVFGIEQPALGAAPAPS
jgi:hypothetical protein